MNTYNCLHETEDTIEKTGGINLVQFVLMEKYELLLQ